MVLLISIQIKKLLAEWCGFVFKQNRRIKVLLRLDKEIHLHASSVILVKVWHFIGLEFHLPAIRPPAHIVSMCRIFVSIAPLAGCRAYPRHTRLVSFSLNGSVSLNLDIEGVRVTLLLYAQCAWKTKIKSLSSCFELSTKYIELPKKIMTKPNPKILFRSRIPWEFLPKAIQQANNSVQHNP